jgi:hypothetical protein
VVFSPSPSGSWHWIAHIIPHKNGDFSCIFPLKAVPKNGSGLSDPKSPTGRIPRNKLDKERAEFAVPWRHGMHGMHGLVLIGLR